MSVKYFAYRLLTLVKFKSIFNVFCSDIEEIPTLQYFKSQTFKILVLDMIFCVQFGQYFVVH